MWLALWLTCSHGRRWRVPQLQRLVMWTPRLPWVVMPLPMSTCLSLGCRPMMLLLPRRKRGKTRSRHCPPLLRWWRHSAKLATRAPASAASNPYSCGTHAVWCASGMACVAVWRRVHSTGCLFVRPAMCFVTARLPSPPPRREASASVQQWQQAVLPPRAAVLASAHQRPVGQRVRGCWRVRLMPCRC